jgi:hypothetical protein
MRDYLSPLGVPWRLRALAFAPSPPLPVSPSPIQSHPLPPSPTVPNFQTNPPTVPNPPSFTPHAHRGAPSTREFLQNEAKIILSHPPEPARTRPNCPNLPEPAARAPVAKQTHRPASCFMFSCLHVFNSTERTHLPFWQSHLRNSKANNSGDRVRRIRQGLPKVKTQQNPRGDIKWRSGASDHEGVSARCGPGCRSFAVGRCRARVDDQNVRGERP